MSHHVNSGRFLLEASLAESTRKKYNRAVQLFLQWCNRQHRTAATFDDLDDLITDYFHDLYEQGDGKGKGLAADTLYGVCKYFPRAQGHLPTAEQSLRGWQRLQTSISYPPLTWELTVAISVQMCRHGLVRQGIGTLLAFDCFLRVGELVGLHKSDVADVGDIRVGSGLSGMCLRLRQTKTGANQWVQVENPHVQKLLRVVMTGTQRPSDRLFPFTSASYRTTFKSICAELGLSEDYVPHSLRHGGATHWHITGHRIEDILMRGRWQSTKSARRYVQAGRAMLLSMDVPVHIARIGEQLGTNVLLSISLSLPQKH
jgi:integrase